MRALLTAGPLLVSLAAPVAAAESILFTGSLSGTVTVTRTFTAANGDTLTADFTGQATLVSTGVRRRAGAWRSKSFNAVTSTRVPG